jgi:hypothetical protein
MANLFSFFDQDHPYQSLLEDFYSPEQPGAFCCIKIESSSNLGNQ